MDASPASLPNPRPRLLRTWLKWCRPVRAFAPRFDTAAALANLPDLAEAAHWGEVTLLEDVVVALHRDGTTSWLTHTVTMPHGDQNLADWDEVIRVFDPKKIRLALRKAVVYLPDGTQRKATRQVLPANGSERSMKLTFAPLRPGVVVEFEMQEDQFTPDEVGPALWMNFAMQSFTPCRRRRFTAAIAEPFAATVKQHHFDQPPRETVQDGYRLLQWEATDVEGIEADNWTPNQRDFAAWVDISTLKNWHPVSAHYCQELVPAGPTPDAVKKLAADLTKDATTVREKAMSIYRYATRHVRYGRHPSELEVPKTRDANKVLEELRGDCKDKSSLMVSLLAEIGVRGQVAVLLTSVNGRAPMLPSRRFDHAIVRATIDGETLWFDPAAGTFSFGDIPLSDQGVKALIIDPLEPEWVDIPEDPPNRQGVQRLCTGELNSEGDYRFRAQITARGEKAAMYRLSLLDRSDDHRRRMVQQSVGEERPGAEVDGIAFGDIEDLSGPLTCEYSVRLPNWSRRIQDLLLFHVPWAETAEVTGPISAPERLHPLQVPGASRTHERHRIKLPTGFHGYGLPYRFEHRCPWANYLLTVIGEGQELICERQMETVWGIVPADRFAEFKQFWEQCARADLMDVVLMRTAPG